MAHGRSRFRWHRGDAALPDESAFSFAPWQFMYDTYCMTAKPMTKARMTNADAVRSENADFLRGVGSRGVIAVQSLDIAVCANTANLAPPKRISCPSASEAGLSVTRVSPTKVPLLDFESTNSHRRLRRLNDRMLSWRNGGIAHDNVRSIRPLPIDVWALWKTNLRRRPGVNRIDRQQATDRVFSES